MENKEEWVQVLDAARGELPQAYLAVGRLVRANVGATWQLPPVPQGRPFLRHRIYGDEEGEVSIVHFGGPVVTMPHTWPGGRVFYCLVEGDLNQRTWRWSQGSLVGVAERRVTAPDLLLSRPGTIYSFASPEGAVCLAVHCAPRPALEMYDPGGRVTEVLGPGADVVWPVDRAQVIQTRPWTEAGP